MELKKTVHVIITGGTIDSYYEGSKDTVMPNTESVLPSYINGMRLYHDFTFTTVCMKDSRDITDEDRAKILQTIQEAPEQYYIITHGTYTMPQTALYLQKHLPQTDKTIILMGPMIPLQGFTMSDGGFNLGFALANVLTVQSGVYVAMNGHLFTPDNVQKNVAVGRFESIFT